MLVYQWCFSLDCRCDSSTMYRFVVFFFKQKTAYEMRISDWSSDVCSSDLPAAVGLPSGRWRGNADHYAAFFNECFIDELAQAAKIEPMSFRMQMLGDRKSVV